MTRETEWARCTGEITRPRTILILGLVCRETFSFWTGHPYDFELWVRTGYWVVRGVSPYGIVPPAPGLSFVNDISAGGNPTIGYLALWPLILGAMYEVFALVGGGDRLVYYFWLKQPMIAADVALGYLLFLYVRRTNPSKASLVLKLWLFSPFTIILSGVWGMFDSLAMVFVVGALLAPSGLKRSSLEGVAILMKSIPLILILPVTRGKRWVLNLAVAAGLPLLFTALVVVVARWPLQVVTATLQSTLGKGGLSLSIWGTVLYLHTLNILPDASLGYYNAGAYVWIPAILVASLLAYRWFGFDSERGMVRSLIFLVLTFLLTRGQVNEQYAIYLLALLLIDVALWNPHRMRLFAAMTGVVLAALLTNDILLLRFVAPVYPEALRLEGNILSVIDPYRNAALYVEGLAFTTLNIVYLYSLIKERKAASSESPPEF